MSKIAIVLADGFEEIEAITTLDILRRAKESAKLVGLNKKMVTGSHGVIIQADDILDNVNSKDYKMIILPGGLPGAQNLANSQKLLDLLKEFNNKNLKIGAICAAPLALRKAGILNNYVCYPGFESVIGEDGYKQNLNYLVDKNIITGKGPALTLEFALEILKFCENENYESVKSEILFSDK